MLKILFVFLIFGLMGCSVTEDLFKDNYGTYMVGDSIMAWSGLENYIPNSTNRAIPGNTIQSVLAVDSGISGSNIIIWVGCNTLGLGYTFDQSTNFYTTMIDGYRSRFQNIYCISILKINFDMYTNNYGLTKHAVNMPPDLVDRFNDYISNISGIHYIDVVDSLSSNGQAITNYFKDGIHPNDLGNSIADGLIQNYIY